MNCNKCGMSTLPGDVCPRCDGDAVNVIMVIAQVLSWVFVIAVACLFIYLSR